MDDITYEQTARSCVIYLRVSHQPSTEISRLNRSLNRLQNPLVSLPGSCQSFLTSLEQDYEGD